MKNEIPKPIIFNPYKHHYYFINEQIRLHNEKLNNQRDTELLNISDNMLDLYYGNLTVNQICKECLRSLSAASHLQRPEFLRWLKPAGYKKIKLSDGSRWLIREGESPERYIHIHPAKNSLYTIRVRGTTLKTVVAMQLTRLNHPENNVPTVDEVNKIRGNILNLSPVKKLEPGKGILKLWRLFKRW